MQNGSFVASLTGFSEEGKQKSRYFKEKDAPDVAAKVLGDKADAVRQLEVQA